jgi:hypothetical protein
MAWGHKEQNLPGREISKNQYEIGQECHQAPQKDLTETGQWYHHQE